MDKTNKKKYIDGLKQAKFILSKTKTPPQNEIN